MEKDDEVKGSGNSYTAENWIYDPRLGKRGNPDKKGKVWESSYATLGNNPIGNIDPKGDDWYTSNGNDFIWFQNKAEIHLTQAGDIYVHVTDRWVENIEGIGQIEWFDSGMGFPEYNINGEYLGGKHPPQTQRELYYVNSCKAIDDLEKMFAIGLAAPFVAPFIVEGTAALTTERVFSAGSDFTIQMIAGEGDNINEKFNNVNWTSIGLSALYATPSISNFAKVGGLSTAFQYSFEKGNKNIFNEGSDYGDMWVQTALSGAFGYGFSKVGNYLDLKSTQLARISYNTARELTFSGYGSHSIVNRLNSFGDFSKNVIPKSTGIGIGVLQNVLQQKTTDELESK